MDLEKTSKLFRENIAETHPKIMTFFKNSQQYKPKKKFLDYFIDNFWYIPSDVLQRSMEANIWNLCSFKHPILEIGIGNGALTKLLFNNISFIDVGIDIEPTGLEQARKTKIYKKVLEANAEKMPFSNNTFSTVIANSTFEHIKHDILALKEVSRVLKKNGLFFFTVPSNFLQSWILEYEKIRIKELANLKVKDFNSRAEHFHYRSINDWQRLLSQSGLELIFSKYYFRRSETLFWYKIFRIFTKKIGKRELWSWIGDSRLTRIIPKSFMKLIEYKILEKHFQSAFILEEDEGGQLFIVARKV